MLSKTATIANGKNGHAGPRPPAPAMNGVHKPPSAAGWFRVPNGLLEVYGEQLGPTGIAVYCAIALHPNKEGIPFPSYERIAQLVGLKRRAVIRTVKLLIEVGLVVRVPHRRPDGRQLTNRYTLTDPGGGVSSTT